MQKVLIIAFFFPPIAASGSLRPAGIARHLPEFGFRPVVLAAHPESVYPSVQSDSSMDVLVREELEVHRLRYKNRLQQLLAVRERLRGSLGYTRVQEASDRDTPQQEGTATPPGLKDFVLDRMFAFPDQQKYWAKPVLHWIRRLPPSERPDVVLATANPWSSLALARTISESLRIPWVADFRDPWFRNPKPQPSARLLPEVQRREADIIGSANHVIANTPALTAALRSDHPQAAAKITTVTNGFARELMPDRRKVAGSGSIELCHFGTIYPLRNPKRLLLALEQLAQTRSNPAIKLRFIGGWDIEDSETDRLAKALEQRGLLERERSVPRDVALRKMAESSHLLILQQDFPLQIPAKLYEYIATGRPIIAIGGPGATRMLIDDNRLGLCCGDDPQEISALLQRLLDEPGRMPRPSASVIERFEYRQIAARVAKILGGVLA